MSGQKAPLAEALEVLLRFGSLMLRAGDTAFRVRESMGMLATSMGIESLSLHITIGGMTATVRRNSEQVTLASEVSPPGINAWRIGALERLARTRRPDLAPKDLAADLDAIEAVPPIHSIITVAAAMGLASGAFSYLNDSDMLGTGAAIAAGCLGQAARMLMFRRHLNQYAVTALCAVLASGAYCLIVAGISGQGFRPSDAGGFISSVLFLVPGFPLVASLLDLLQHQTVAGVARLFYGILILLAAAFGLSLVAAVAGLASVPVSTPHGVELVPVLWRAVASFAGGCGFAILYNSPARTVLAVGLLSLLGNDLRLVLHDLGMALPPATFFGAFAVGLLASLARATLREPRIALTVPGIIIMTPGIYAFQTIVFLNQGDILAAIQAGAVCCFIVGGMAMGLAAARFISERRWIIER
ncbi:MAG: threonine/serine ThrE exporter family protein [Reyranella sp.]